MNTTEWWLDRFGEPEAWGIALELERQIVSFAHAAAIVQMNDAELDRLPVEHLYLPLEHLPAGERTERARQKLRGVADRRVRQHLVDWTSAELAASTLSSSTGWCRYAGVGPTAAALTPTLSFVPGYPWPLLRWIRTYGEPFFWPLARAHQLQIRSFVSAAALLQLENDEYLRYHDQVTSAFGPRALQPGIPSKSSAERARQFAEERIRHPVVYHDAELGLFFQQQGGWALFVPGLSTPDPR